MTKYVNIKDKSFILPERYTTDSKTKLIRLSEASKVYKGLGAIRPYMASYLMNFRKYLIKSRCVLFFRQHHTFDVKTCFQQNRYIFDVIGASCTSFIFCISLNFADISTVFEEIKHLHSRAPNKYFNRLLKLMKHKYR